MRALECEYSVLDENDNLVAVTAQDISVANLYLSEDDYFVASLESLIECGTGALIVVR